MKSKSTKHLYFDMSIWSSALSFAIRFRLTSEDICEIKLQFGLTFPSIMQKNMAIKRSNGNAFGPEIEKSHKQWSFQDFYSMIMNNGIRSGQVRSGQVRSGQVRSGQIRSGQVRSGQVRSAQVRLGQVRSGLKNTP